MIFYLIPATPSQPEELAGTQSDARELCKAKGLKPGAFEQVDVPTAKWELMNHLNVLMAKAHPVGAQSVAEAEEFVERSGQPVAPLNDHKPAFTQGQVDIMFTSIDEKALPDVDTVCHAIATFRGAAIGHVAHELMARIDNLAKEVMA